MFSHFCWKLKLCYEFYRTGTREGYNLYPAQEFYLKKQREKKLKSLKLVNFFSCFFVYATSNTTYFQTTSNNRNCTFFSGMLVDRINQELYAVNLTHSKYKQWLVTMSGGKVQVGYDPYTRRSKPNGNYLSNGKQVTTDSSATKVKETTTDPRATTEIVVNETRVDVTIAYELDKIVSEKNVVFLAIFVFILLILLLLCCICTEIMRCIASVMR